MPRREPIAFVWDIQDACRAIADFLNRMTRNEYFADELKRSAVERQLITIGEAMNKLSALDPAMAAELGDTAKIVGFRNALVHGYFTIDHEEVWEILESHFPEFKAAADAMWARFAPLYEEGSKE